MAAIDEEKMRKSPSPQKAPITKPVKSPNPNRSPTVRSPKRQGSILKEG